MGAHLGQFALQTGGVGEAVAGVAGQAGAADVVLQRPVVFARQEQLADRGEVQGRPAADGAHHLHAAALGQGTLDVDDLVTLADGEVDGLSGEAVQLAHGAHGSVAHVEPGLDQVAQFQQPQSQLVAAGVDAIDEAGGDQVVEDAMGSGWVQCRATGQFLQADGPGLLGQRVEQRHHAFQDLDGGLDALARARGGLGARLGGNGGFRRCVVCHQGSRRALGEGPWSDPPADGFIC